MKNKQMKEQIVEKILISNYEKYYRLAFSYVHNEADAQDIVQEGAYKAILKSGSLKNPEYAATWIYRIMLNEAISHVTENRQMPVSPEDMPETAVEDRYADVDLKQAVEKLEPLEQAVVVLRYFDDLKFDQIAEITKENQNTVKARLYRALRKLGVLLAPEQECKNLS